MRLIISIKALDTPSWRCTSPNSALFRYLSGFSSILCNTAAKNLCFFASSKITPLANSHETLWCLLSHIFHLLRQVGIGEVRSVAAHTYTAITKREFP